MPNNMKSKKISVDPDKFISEVWYLGNRKYAFQKVGMFFELYDKNGNFLKEFRSFVAMTLFMEESED